jgi:hypothetical protein
MESRHKDSCTTLDRLSNGVTQEAKAAVYWIWQSRRTGRSSGKSELHKAEALRDVDPSGEADCLMPHCRENPLARLECVRTVNRHRWTRRVF